MTRRRPGLTWRSLRAARSGRCRPSPTWSTTLSKVPSAVSDLRNRIIALRFKSIIPGHVEKLPGCTNEYISHFDPEPYEFLWDLWRLNLPQHPPPERFPVRDWDDAEDALDRFMQKLEDLF